MSWFSDRSWRHGRAPAGRRRRPGSRLAAGLAGLAVAVAVSGPARGDGPEGPAADGLGLTLRESIELTLRNNRWLVNARLDREVQRMALRVKENRFLPHVTVGPYLEQSHDDPATDVTRAGVQTAVTLRMPTGGEFGVRWSGDGLGGDVPAAGRYASELRFTFRQPLLRGAGIGVNRAPLDMARLTERINELALRRTVIDVVSAVIGRYLAQLQAVRRVEIRADSLGRARELLAVNEELVRTGRMARRDIVQAEADIARRELELIAARNTLAAAQLALADILDIDGGTRFRLTDTLAGMLAPEVDRADVPGSVAAALGNRPDWLGAVLGIRHAETRVRVAGNERLWDLSASVSADFRQAGEDASAVLGRFRGADYGGRLDLTIPLGPAALDPVEQNFVQADTDLKKARNDLADLRQRIDIEVSNAVREVELSARQVELARTVRELARQKTEIEREKLRLGLSSNFRLVRFEDDLVAAENIELDATIAHLGALASLDRVRGTVLESWGIEIVDLDREAGR